jgi:nitroreductase
MSPKTPGYETAELRQVEELLRGRRTIDLYLQTPVPRQLVIDAVESATWAPNHKLTEPWRFFLLGPASIERCLDLNEAIVSAKKGAEAGAFKRRRWSEKPGWLVVTCRRNSDALRQQEDYGACCAAVQNFALHLWKAGVGSKWTSGDITRDPRFAAILGIDFAIEFVVGLVWFGYPKLTPTQSRKGLDQVLTELP